MTTPQAISEISDPDPIRVQLYASDRDAHAPLIEAVRAGANGRLLPAGGEAGEALIKASATDYDVIWSTSLGLRAFANIDGEAVTIREASNVASVSRPSTGNFTLTWIESITSSASITITAGDTGTPGVYVANITSITTTGCQFQIRNHLNALSNCDTICVHVAGLHSDFLLLSGSEQTTGTDKVELSGSAAPGVEETSGTE